MTTIYLECSEIKEEFGCFFIQTHSEKVMDCYIDLKNETLQNVKAVYIGAICSLKVYNKEKLIELHTEKSDKWQNWCDDVLLFYVSRLILFNERIPIIDEKLMESIQNRIV
jgi:hypothetical protein